MPSSGSVTIWARDLDAGSYDNCTSKSGLSFSFSEDRNEVKKDFGCADLPDGKSARISVRIYVWDEAGLFDYCNTSIQIQDGIGNRCPDTLSGVKNKAPINLPVAQSPGSNIPGGLIQGASVANKEVLLLQNLPNPFHSSTRIRFVLGQNEKFRLRIVDLTGRTLWIREGSAGNGLNEVLVKGTDLKGAGLYYYSLELENRIMTKKMILSY
jgi:hypothetical protein